jgi:tetratricopeptide (TPR) repeat protein
VIGHILRGFAYHNDRNPQQAAAAFERALELDPDLREMPAARTLFWDHFTEDLAASGRLSDAARYLGQALDKGADPELMNRLGTTFFLQGDLDQAEACFRQAIEWDPNRYSPHLNLAKLALQRRQIDQALEELNKASALAPGHHAVLYNLASLYRRLGRTAEAERMQATIAQSRARTASAPSAGGRWPPYAL